MLSLALSSPIILFSTFFQIKMLRDAEVLSDYNTKRANVIPLVSEAEMLLEKESGRVDKLRKLGDRIIKTVAERSQLLVTLRERASFS